tara:strand:+ start:632 stop:1012 length:381 start_codon:yes stop_codon:yes gene_type:complete
MRSIIKFKRKNGDFRIYSPDKIWETCNGIHYIHYPFIIHRTINYNNLWSITHIASGTQACRTSNLKVAKYIASRLIVVPQFFLPHRHLVDYMSIEQRKYCTDIISRYRDESTKRLEELDKNCPFTI